MRLLQLLGPGETLSYPAALALARRCVRRGGQAIIAGPLLRYQQEQILFTEARWVNMALAPFEETAPAQAEQAQVARLIRDFKPDLVHTYGLPALRAAAPTRSPLICTLSDLIKHPLAGWPRWRTRRMLRRCRDLVVSSESEREALARLDPGLARRAHLIHPPAEVKPVSSSFDLARKRRTLGLRSETAVVGVISPAVKGLGLESVVAAAVEITREFPNVEFLFVGDGPDQEELGLLAHHSGIGGATVFRGDRADISEIVATLNVLVIPAETPGSVAHALQAVAMEVPVLAVRTPALAEVLEPIDPTGFIPPSDAEALAQMLSQRLEILPPPGDDAFTEFGGFSQGEMLVSNIGFDLDGIGLEAEWRGDESERQAAARRGQERFGITAAVTAAERVYGGAPG